MKTQLIFHAITSEYFERQYQQNSLRTPMLKRKAESAQKSYSLLVRKRYSVLVVQDFDSNEISNPVFLFLSPGKLYDCNPFCTGYMFIYMNKQIRFVENKNKCKEV